MQIPSVQTNKCIVEMIITKHYSHQKIPKQLLTEIERAARKIKTGQLDQIQGQENERDQSLILD